MIPPKLMLKDSHHHLIKGVSYVMKHQRNSATTTVARNRTTNKHVQKLGHIYLYIIWLTSTRTHLQIGCHLLKITKMTDYARLFFPLFWGLYPIADSIELSSMRKKAAVPWHKLPEKLASGSFLRGNGKFSQL